MISKIHSDFMPGGMAIYYLTCCGKTCRSVAHTGGFKETVLICLQHRLQDWYTGQIDMDGITDLGKSSISVVGLVHDILR